MVAPMVKTSNTQKTVKNRVNKGNLSNVEKIQKYIQEELTTFQKLKINQDIPELDPSHKAYTKLLPGDPALIEKAENSSGYTTAVLAECAFSVNIALTQYKRGGHGLNRAQQLAKNITQTTTIHSLLNILHDHLDGKTTYYTPGNKKDSFDSYLLAAIRQSSILCKFLNITSPYPMHDVNKSNNENCLDRTQYRNSIKKLLMNKINEKSVYDVETNGKNAKQYKETIPLYNQYRRLKQVNNLLRSPLTLKESIPRIHYLYLVVKANLTFLAQTNHDTRDKPAAENLLYNLQLAQTDDLAKRVMIKHLKRQAYDASYFRPANAYIEMNSYDTYLIKILSSNDTFCKSIKMENHCFNFQLIKHRSHCREHIAQTLWSQVNENRSTVCCY